VEVSQTPTLILERREG